MKYSIHTNCLSLIYYQPSGAQTGRTCAAIWEESKQVRLVSPFLRKRQGVLDPQPFIKKFPCAGGAVEPFERAMEWLDSVCYAAKCSAEVLSTCSDAPEWGLRCVPYDASDRTLGMGGLSKPLVSDSALLTEVARQCLLQSVKRLLMEDPSFSGTQIEILDPDNPKGDVATVHFSNGNAGALCRQCGGPVHSCDMCIGGVCGYSPIPASGQAKACNQNRNLNWLSGTFVNPGQQNK